MKNILIPVDFSDSSTAVLDYVKNDFCKSVSVLSRIHLLNVITEPVYVGFDGLPMTIPPGWLDDVKSSAHNKLESYKCMLPKEVNVLTEVRLAQGSIHQEILAYAKEVGVDLIVIGTHGRNAIERFILGSVAEKLLRSSMIPILALPPKMK